MAKRGPKKIEINWEEFEKLCALQCTLAEIAGWFGCSEDTIERRCKEKKKLKFAEYYRQKKIKGNIPLRRAQMQTALNGNAAMQIWLGKQYLSQKDSVDVVEDKGGIVFNVNFGRRKKKKK